jgi:transcriptional regulator with XRE-family HTH domain
MTPDTLRSYRKAKKESQLRFWGRFGVTQSRGSRFELGMEIPAPVAILLTLYLEGKITDVDLRLACKRRFDVISSRA